MVVIAERDEAKRLEDAAGRAAHRAEHFRHSLHIARMGLKRQLYKVAVAQRARELQQPAGDRNHLQFAFGAKAISQLNDGRRGCELNSSSALEGINLGIVGHATITIASAEARGEITEEPCTNSR